MFKNISFALLVLVGITAIGHSKADPTPANQQGQYQQQPNNYPPPPSYYPTYPAYPGYLAPGPVDPGQDEADQIYRENQHPGG